MKIIELTYLTYLRMLSFTAPKLAGQIAFDLFQKTLPMKSRFRKREKLFYKNSISRTIENVPEDNLIYESGDPNGELVILVHGWNSNAGSMERISHSLEREGKRVVSIDLPGHGQSKLKRSNIYLCREALRNLIHDLKPGEQFSLVTHSWGSAVAAYALKDSIYKIENWVMLSTPNKLTDFMEEFKNYTGLGNDAYRIMESKGNKILPDRISSLIVSDWLEAINIENLTIIHEREDKVIPFSDSEKIKRNHPRTKLIPVDGIGHYRMLTNAKIVNQVLDLIKTQPIQAEKPERLKELLLQTA